jgi:nicotinamidase-related amidase
VTEYPIQLDRMALVNVDMQVAFVEGTPLSAPRGRDLVDVLNPLIRACRQAGLMVIHTRHVTRQDVPTYHEIRPLEGEKVILKHRYSAFFDTDLHTYLRGCKVDTVIITGCMTNYCCGATARDAFFRDYKVIFGSDLNATDSQELHEAELKTLRRGYARVISVDEIMEKLGS